MEYDVVFTVLEVVIKVVSWFALALNTALQTHQFFSKPLFLSLVDCLWLKQFLQKRQSFWFVIGRFQQHQIFLGIFERQYFRIMLSLLVLWNEYIPLPWSDWWHTFRDHDLHNRFPPQMLTISGICRFVAHCRPLNSKNLPTSTMLVHGQYPSVKIALKQQSGDKVQRCETTFFLFVLYR